jgi:hypothetical protein
MSSVLLPRETSVAGAPGASRIVSLIARLGVHSDPWCVVSDDDHDVSLRPTEHHDTRSNDTRREEPIDEDGDRLEGGGRACGPTFHICGGSLSDARLKMITFPKVCFLAQVPSPTKVAVRARRVPPGTPLRRTNPRRIK